MKKITLFIFLLLHISLLKAQTATNFTCNDCSGVSHDLFTELDAGKVIVLCWVMPCGACTGPATTAFNTVQSFQATNPNQVYLYLVDDYGNSTCSFINSWANGIGVTQSAWSLRFSNSAINMTDYGSTGMPKIVVLGGSSHTVFYNTNNTVNQTALQNAINTALATTGLQENNNDFKLSVFPNPTASTAKVSFTLAATSEVTITISDLQGKMTKQIMKGSLSAGNHEIPFSTSELESGMYLIRVSDGKTEHAKNVTVRH